MVNYLKRAALCMLALVAVACAKSQPETKVEEQPAAKPAANTDVAATEFVQVNGGRFTLRGQDYAYIGTNMWFAAYIGSTNPEYGDRERLIKELDLLKSLGVTNLRILGASEKSPLRDSMKPAISERGEINQHDILEGLDFALAEMAKRDMKAVIFLNNFWEWSGGMATYLSWVNGGEIVDMADPTKPWPAFALFSAGFYSNEEAKQLFNNYLTKVVSRRNTITGELYANDPTIMSWQLANEPRPGNGDVSLPNLPAYYDWISKTTQLIKSIAPKQLVSIGSEGTMGCLELDECVITAHKETGIDYVTFHMWLKNWGWFDVQNAEQTYDSAVATADKYIDHHIKLANELNMPVVLEEFGMERDGGEFSPESAVTYRDKFYAYVFDRQIKSIRSGGPFVGSNFWAWGGYGKAMHDDAVWRKGDKTFVGDPPQEPQGLNAVFASDTSTLEVLKQAADAIR